MSKIEPSVQTMVFPLVNPATDPGTPNTQYYYIDLSQCASLLNRRFYRQGINWAVAGFKFIGTTSAGININKLPNTWVMSNAWEKSMRAWMRMNKESLTETDSIRPRFLDFKIYANSLHHANGYSNNLLPIASRFGTGGITTAGEWESSKIVVPETSTATGAATSYELVAVGANNPGVGASGFNAKSLIEGYASSRSLPNIEDPNTPDDAASYTENWMMAMFNDGTLQDNVVITDMITENNLAPYPFENDGVNFDTMYPGGANQLTNLQVHGVDNITGTTVGGVSRVKGGNFPCGLIEIAYTPTEAGSTPLLVLDLIPGSHRGYLCEPMTEM